MPSLQRPQVFYPHSMGGGVKRLFRKQGNKSADYGGCLGLCVWAWSCIVWSRGA